VVAKGGAKKVSGRRGLSARFAAVAAIPRTGVPVEPAILAKWFRSMLNGIKQ